MLENVALDIQASVFTVYAMSSITFIEHSCQAVH